MTSGDKHSLDIYLSNEKVGQLSLDRENDQLSIEYETHEPEKQASFRPTPESELIERPNCVISM